MIVVDASVLAPALIDDGRVGHAARLRMAGEPLGAYQGYQSSGGALGVGRATTNAVVGATVLILATNYLITALYIA